MDQVTFALSALAGRDEGPARLTRIAYDLTDRPPLFLSGGGRIVGLVTMAHESKRSGGDMSDLDKRVGSAVWREPVLYDLLDRLQSRARLTTADGTHKTGRALQDAILAQSTVANLKHLFPRDFPAAGPREGATAFIGIARIP